MFQNVLSLCFQSVLSDKATDRVEQVEGMLDALQITGS